MLFFYFNRWERSGALGGVNDVSGASCQGWALPTSWAPGPGALAGGEPWEGRGCCPAYLYPSSKLRPTLPLVPGESGKRVSLLEVQHKMKGRIIFFNSLIFWSEGSEVGGGRCAFRYLLVLQMGFAVPGPGWLGSS